MHKVRGTTREQAVRVSECVPEILVHIQICVLTLRSTEEVIPNSSAISGKEGAIIDEAKGSRNANTPIVIAAPLRTLLGHCRGSIAVVWSSCCDSLLSLSSPFNPLSLVDMVVSVCTETRQAAAFPHHGALNTKLLDPFADMRRASFVTSS
jgi:hypothetical protein